ncbi:MAG TPA: hypothetical protein VJ943_12225 [Desulfotignum sp.]|nr:hypothetical protein [Desulfotignum sp.]
MEKDNILTNGAFERTFMPTMQGSLERENPYTDTGIYLDEEDIANALCLVDLMINKKSL